MPAGAASTPDASAAGGNNPLEGGSGAASRNAARPIRSAHRRYDLRRRIAIVRDAGGPVPGKIDVEMIAVIGRARSKHGREALAGGRLDLAQEPPRLGIATPTGLHRDLAAVLEEETRDVEGIAERVFGEARAMNVVAAPAVVVGDLPDRRDRHAIPGDCRRLHRFAKPALDRVDQRAAKRGVRADGDKPRLKAETRSGKVMPQEPRPSTSFAVTMNGELANSWPVMQAASASSRQEARCSPMKLKAQPARENDADGGRQIRNATDHGP